MNLSLEQIGGVISLGGMVLFIIRITGKLTSRKVPFAMSVILGALSVWEIQTSDHQGGFFAGWSIVLLGVALSQKIPDNTQLPFWLGIPLIAVGNVLTFWPLTPWWNPSEWGDFSKGIATPLYFAIVGLTIIRGWLLPFEWIFSKKAEKQKATG